MYMDIYIYTHTHTHIYIYIHVYTYIFISHLTVTNDPHTIPPASLPPRPSPAPHPTPRGSRRRDLWGTQAFKMGVEPNLL